MYVYYSDQIPLKTLRHALVVMTFCYLPYITTTPWWLSILAGLTVTYRLAGSYWNFPIPPFWSRAIIAVFTIYFLAIHYQPILSSGFFIGVLIAFFWLKLLELHKKRDIKVLFLISLYVIFSALIIHANLWIFVYVVIAMFGILSLLVMLHIPSFSLPKIVNTSFIIMILAIPVSTLMFFSFPRITAPLWILSIPPKATTGFSENLSPGSVSNLQKDNSTVMRIRFNLNKARTIDLYWKGLILSHFDGVTWNNKYKKSSTYRPLPVITDETNADYEILIESHNKKWLFYLDEPYAGWPKLQYSQRTGLIRQDFKTVNQTLMYQLSSRPAEYKPINRLIKRKNLSIPPNSNPKLKDWSRNKMKEFNHDVEKFTQFLQTTIRNQNFWYTLQPQSIGKRDNQLDKFWFETRDGFCESYASAAAFIYRSAGIPARVLVGYRGGEWNPVGQYLNVRKMDAHAWVEYWQDDKGWQRFDATQYIHPQRIDQSILDQFNQNHQAFNQWNFAQVNLSWMQRIKISYESFKYFAERWVLFYNKEKQKQLFQKLGYKNVSKSVLLKICLGLLLLFLFLGWLVQHIKIKVQNPLHREYALLKKEIRRHGIDTSPPRTLHQQLYQLKNQYTELSGSINDFINSYENHRLSKDDRTSKTNQDIICLLIKRFRKKLKHNLNRQSSIL